MIKGAIDKLKKKYVSKYGIEWGDIKNDAKAMTGFGETRAEQRALRDAKRNQPDIDKKLIESLFDKNGVLDTKVLQSMRDRALKRTDLYKSYEMWAEGATPKKLKKLILTEKELLDGKPIDEVSKIIKRIKRRQLISNSATAATAGALSYLSTNGEDKK